MDYNSAKMMTGGLMFGVLVAAALIVLGLL